MRKLFIAAAAASLSIASSASAQILIFEFDITVDQEVPAPNIPMGFNPSGTGTLTLDRDNNMIEWVIEYQGLSGPIVAPGAHFHGPADFGETGGIQVFLTDGTPAEPASGVLMGSASITEQQEINIIDGLWYVNIHTDLNQSGEIRGQVIPAPAALALLGIGGLAAGRRRRRG